MGFRDRREARLAQRLARERADQIAYDQHLAEQKRIKENEEANLVYLHIRKWLRLLEGYRNLRFAPDHAKHPRETGCRVREHRMYGNPTPYGDLPDRVVCAIPLDKHPQRAVQACILDELQKEGFRLEQLTKNPCGCVTFTVRPRRRP